MARWRTHNKRAKRVRARDEAFKRNVDEIVRAAMIAAFEDACKQLAENITNNFAKMLHRLADSMRAFAESQSGWQPLDPKYAGLRDTWPDEVFEDILDAEYIE